MSAAGIESLVALKRLKTLHMNRLLGNFEGLVELTLDDGNKVRVLGREAERFRQALQTLRRSKPGITLDSDNLFRSDGFEERSLTWDYDALADHHDNWLPASRMPSVPWSSIAFYYDSEAIMGLKW